MKTLGDIWVDLVDKKLWPLAVVLIAALVAVPVLLAKPADPSTSPPAPPPAGVQAPGLAGLSGTVALADGGDGVVAGSPTDPFRQQHVPKPPAISAPSQSADAQPGGAGSGASGGGDSGGSSGGGSDSGSSRPTRAPAPTTYSVVVRYGVSGSGRPRRELSPLTALPSSASPLFVYLGSVNANRTAVFLVSSDATPTGDGRCTPTRAICSQVYLDPGQTEYFDVNTGRGVVQYQLDVLKIAKR